MQKIDFKIENKVLYQLQVDEQHVIFQRGKQQFKAEKNKIEIQLQPVQVAKDNGYLAFDYSFKKGKPREFLYIEGFNNKKLVDCIKILEVIEKQQIRTELLPMEFDV